MLTVYKKKSFPMQCELHFYTGMELVEVKKMTSDSLKVKKAIEIFMEENGMAGEEFSFVDESKATVIRFEQAPVYDEDKLETFRGMHSEELIEKMKRIEDRASAFKGCNDGSYEMALALAGHKEIKKVLEERIAK